MKRIIFLLLCLIPLSAKADMDKICIVASSDLKLDNLEATMSKVLKEQNCQRNNILEVINIDPENLMARAVVVKYCRYDRNVIKTPYSFSCVLYSKNHRRYN